MSYDDSGNSTIGRMGLGEVGHGQGVKSRDRANWNHLDPDVLNWQWELGAERVN